MPNGKFTLTGCCTCSCALRHSNKLDQICSAKTGDKVGLALTNRFTLLSFHTKDGNRSNPDPLSLENANPDWSESKFDEELVEQNLRREPHSSVTIRRFRKLKSCFYIIAIPSGWHRCPNPNCNARF